LNSSNLSYILSYDFFAAVLTLVHETRVDKHNSSSGFICHFLEMTIDIRISLRLSISILRELYSGDDLSSKFELDYKYSTSFELKVTIQSVLW
jgi:hypothetical protein